jgi:hypothetical protein
MTEVIDPTNGEYRQDIAEKPNTDEPKKPGVQVNIDESNAANEKLEADSVPNSFDNTEEGQRKHAEKFGGLTKEAAPKTSEVKSPAKLSKTR